MTENKEHKVKDRISFLAEKFNVFETDDEKDVEKKIKKLEEDGNSVLTIKSNDKLLAILSLLKTEEKVQKSVSVSFSVFSDIIESDPTPNKSCVQWMLNVFTRLIKSGGSGIDSAIRFVVEDLPQASEYISLFEANKRKDKFKKFCKSSFVLRDVEDPTDINQYKSLSQLFDSVDPFILRKPSEVESLMQRFVTSGDAEIPVNDRKFLLFIPKTVDANVIFDKFANWCTAKPKNGMFRNYTENNKQPDGSKSKIYIIINKKFFSGESQEIYQIHFETNQIKDRHNSQNVSIFENVINQSEGISNFFHEELMNNAKKVQTGLDNNKYLDFLIKFGFCESLFELIDKKTPVIRFMTREIPRLPDISKFEWVDQLIITNASMVELHPSIGVLKHLEMLVLSENKIKKLPKEIGNLKNLTFLNIIGNPITEIPEEIKYLDKTNGGSLFRIAVKKEHIGEKNYQRLKELLPSVKL
jgi:Leucine-rich repeat (LRR) protein